MAKTKKESKRIIIIGAAEKLFFNKGYDNITMQQIADEIKIAKGTLYIYFQSKYDLYVSILTRGTKIMNNMFMEASNSEKRGWNKLKSMGLSFLEFCNKHEGYADFLFNLEARVPSEYLDTKSKNISSLNEENQKTMQIFMDSMALGFKDKSIRTDIEPMKLGIMLSLLSSSLIEHVKKAEPFIKKQKINPKDIVLLAYDLLGEALKPK